MTLFAKWLKIKVTGRNRKEGSLPQVKGYRNNKGNLTWGNKNDAPSWDELAWLLQELRVSLFAQELKMPVIIPVKRLEKMLAETRS